MKSIKNKSAHVIASMLVAIYVGNIWYKVCDKGIQFIVRVKADKRVSFSCTNNGWVTVKYVNGKDVVFSKKLRKMSEIEKEIGWMLPDVTVRTLHHTELSWRESTMDTELSTGSEVIHR